MFIFSIIVMCSYIFTVVLINEFLGTDISRNTLQWLLLNIANTM